MKINTNNKVCKQERSIYLTRRYSQLAEKFGWSIGGFALAYDVSGAIGIITLAIAMILTAALSSGALYHLGIDLQPRLIRNALAWRAFSFTTMLLGGYYGNLWVVVVGGVASGVFVGVFWPTYYRIQRICGLDFSEWNVRDKIAGAFIVLLSGFSVDLLGVELVLIVSLVAILASGKYSMDLMGGHDGRWIAGSTSDVTPFRALSSLPALIAMTEGTFNWMASLTRLLVIMTGLLEVASLPAAVGLGLLLALTEAVGAGITWGVEKRMGESKSVGNKLVAFGLSISFASSLLLASERTWIVGMVLLSIGSAMVFPLLKEEVDGKLDSSGSGGRGLREYSRNIGRLVGSLTIAAIWITIPELPVLALPIAASVLVVACLCIISMGNISITQNWDSSMMKEKEVR